MVYQMTMMYTHNEYSGQTGRGVETRGTQHVRKTLTQKAKGKLYKFLDGRVHKGIWTPVIMFGRRRVKVIERMQKEGKFWFPRSLLIN